VETALFVLGEVATKFRYVLLSLVGLCALSLLLKRLKLVGIPNQATLAACVVCGIVLVVFAGALAIGSAVGLTTDRNLFFLVYQVLFDSWPVILFAAIGLALFFGDRRQ